MTAIMREDLMIEHALASLLTDADRAALSSLKPWEWDRLDPVHLESLRFLARLNFVALDEQQGRVKLNLAGFNLQPHMENWRDEHIDAVSATVRRDLDLEAFAASVRAMAVMTIWRNNMRAPREEIAESIDEGISVRHALETSWSFVEMAWVAHLAYARAPFKDHPRAP